VLIERTEESDEMDEAMEVVGLGIGRIVMFGWEGDCCLEGQWSMSMKGIRSVRSQYTAIPDAFQILPLRDEEQPVKPSSP
jgi:hypothetical protein